MNTKQDKELSKLVARAERTANDLETMIMLLKEHKLGIVASLNTDFADLGQFSFFLKNLENKLMEADRFCENTVRSIIADYNENVTNDVAY